MVVASASVTKVKQVPPQMTASIISVPKDVQSCHLSFWEAYQDQQIGLIQAPFKLCLCAWTQYL